MRSELGKARGLGSAHHGIGHWWMQRLTGLALLPLTIWFVALLAQVADANGTPLQTLNQITALIANPWNALCAVMLVIASFYHLQLGLQVIIEDYIHNTPIKFTSLIVMKLGCFVVASASILAVVMIVVR